MKKNIFFVFCILFFCNTSAQVGINTTNIDPSVRLDINTDKYSNTNKKGFLGPRVKLLSTTDTNTIQSPATGLIVFNTSDSGSYPTNVKANRYYYWDASQWSELALTSTVEEAVVPRIFYGTSSEIQNFTYASLNGIAVTPAQVVNFSNLNVSFSQGDIIEYNTTNSSFKAKQDGIYEVSSFINYNPNHGGTISGFRRSFINYIVQVKLAKGTSFSDILGTRTAWGEGATTYFKTVVIQGVPLSLKKDDEIRFVIINPFTESVGNLQATTGDATIAPFGTMPISRSVKIQLLDFNL